ncbi:hypothetical protein EDB86DRAFT_2952155 [Lactarius hatsudake]|nr:hypothetical protein EDB86DRAFT_2952155 [Lactarius hatsudake]
MVSVSCPRGTMSVLRCCCAVLVLWPRRAVLVSPRRVGVVASLRRVGGLATPCWYCSVAVPSRRCSRTAGLAHRVSPRWRWQLRVCARRGGGHPFET